MFRSKFSDISRRNGVAAINRITLKLYTQSNLLIHSTMVPIESLAFRDKVCPLVSLERRSSTQ